MTKEFAISLMKTATDVKDWNQKRDICKEELSPEDWREVYGIIDQNGFIVKTINK